MAKHGIDAEVLAAVREFGRPVRFRELAEVLETRGATSSQVHNAIYRLVKRGGLQRSRIGAGMTYLVVDT
jgi:DNA-binding transcriptional regulator PaaX